MSARQLALDALKESRTSNDCMEFHARKNAAIEALEAEIAQPVEPVYCQFQGRNGRWHSFITEQHKVDTIADGTWPIRYLFAAPQEPAAPAWIAVSERLPPTGMAVLVLEKKTVLRAAWIAKHTMSDGEFQGDEDYDEATDTSYWPEGWYEWNAHEEVHWSLDDEPTHWTPLPKPPGSAA